MYGTTYVIKINKQDLSDLGLKLGDMIDISEVTKKNDE